MARTESLKDVEKAWEYYKHADTIYAGRVYFFLVAESVLIASVIQVAYNRNAGSPFASLLITLIGLIFTLSWLYVNHRLAKRMTFLDNNYLKLDPVYSRYMSAASGISARILLTYLLPSITLVFWVLLYVATEWDSIKLETFGGQMTWEIVTAISTAASTLIILVTGYFVANQLKEMRNSTELHRRDLKYQAIAQLFDELVTPEFRRKLLFVYSRDPENLILPELSDSEREIVEEITAHFDGLGFRVRKEIIPKEEALELFWDLVVRCAQQLRPHLLDQRERRGLSYEYKADFDWLARECKLFQLKSTGDLTLDELLKLEPLPIFRIEKPTQDKDASSNAN